MKSDSCSSPTLHPPVWCVSMTGGERNRSREPEPDFPLLLLSRSHCRTCCPHRFGWSFACQLDVTSIFLSPAIPLNGINVNKERAAPLSRWQALGSRVTQSASLSAKGMLNTSTVVENEIQRMAGRKERTPYSLPTSCLLTPSLDPYDQFSRLPIAHQTSESWYGLLSLGESGCKFKISPT